MPERIVLLRRMILLGLAVVTVRLAYLQLIKGGLYHRLSESNRLRLVSEPAPRGLILDREGRPLASNQRVFRVAVVPQEAKNAHALWARLASLLHEHPDELARRFEERRFRSFMPVEVASNVPKTSALRIEEERLRLPGVVPEARLSRAYPLGTVAAHLLGYLGQPSPDALEVFKRRGMRAPELMGRAGLEQTLDETLQGQVGGVLIEVNSRGRQVRTIGLQASQPGETVRLTIDARLQALIEREFGEQAGACVVLAPESGAVLAMVSTPAFDPSAFISDQSSLVRQMLADPRAALLNRAAFGMYLPGSIIKPVVALTALARGVVTPTDTVTCPGFLQIGNRRFHCWNRDGHGPLSMREALRESCNVFFLEMGRRLGQERLVEAYRRIGFGHPAGWLLGESAGYLPSGELQGGDSAMLAIGQGQILITPLQAAAMAAALANGGSLVHPWVVAQEGDRRLAGAPATSLGWNRSQLAVVRDGMRAVVNDPAGTGISAHSDAVVIAGKTGTAQTGRSTLTHGWFMGFCPADKPIAAFAIVAEFGGTGGGLPAHIGKAVCEYLAHPDAMEAKTASGVGG